MADVDPSATIGRDSVMDPSSTVGAGAELGERVHLAAWSSIGDGAKVDADVVIDRGAQVENGAAVVNLTPGVRGMVPAYAVVRAGETCELADGHPTAPEKLGQGRKQDFPPGGNPLGTSVGAKAPATPPPARPDALRAFSEAQRISGASRTR